VLVEQMSNEKMHKEKNEQLMELVDVEDEELEIGIEDISVNGTEPISWLPLYMSLGKLTARVTKDLDAIKFSIFTHFTSLRCTL